MDNSIPLQQAWALIAHMKKLPTTVVKAHLDTAKRLKWQYDPVIHCDIHFLVRPFRRKFELNTEISHLLEIFERNGRQIVPYSTDSSLSDRRTKYLKPVWQQSTIYIPWLRLDAEERKTPAGKPAELIICNEMLRNKTPISQETHVTIHNGYSYVSS